MDQGKLVHRRTYDIEGHRIGPDLIELIGTVADRKPPGAWFPGDVEDFALHTMRMRLLVRTVDLTITEVEVEYVDAPHGACSEISGAYSTLVGCSLTRGFSNEVRQRLGGTRGCSHVSALVLAMAPTALQCLWPPEGESPLGEVRGGLPTPPIGSCHVWDDPPKVPPEQINAVPVTMRRRLRDLGLDEDEWLEWFTTPPSRPAEH